MCICDHLKLLEETLLQPKIRNQPAQVSPLLAAEFREIGSSGRVFSREAMLADLQAETTPRHVRLSDFECVRLSDTLVLVIYRTEREPADAPPVAALRSSLWIYRDARWQLIFHQGTSTA